jgi:hypothetical protein
VSADQGRGRDRWRVTAAPVRHLGRVRATDEQRYVVGFTDGHLTVGAEELVVQAVGPDGSPDRRPIVIGRDGVDVLLLRCGLVFGTLRRQLPSGYRADLIRLRDRSPLLADLEAHAWPVRTSGLRAPR